MWRRLCLNFRKHEKGKIFYLNIDLNLLEKKHFLLFNRLDHSSKFYTSQLIHAIQDWSIDIAFLRLKLLFFSWCPSADCAFSFVLLLLTYSVFVHDLNNVFSTTNGCSACTTYATSSTTAISTTTTATTTTITTKTNDSEGKLFFLKKKILKIFIFSIVIGR